MESSHFILFLGLFLPALLLFITQTKGAQSLFSKSQYLISKAEGEVMIPPVAAVMAEVVARNFAAKMVILSLDPKMIQLIMTIK